MNCETYSSVLQGLRIRCEYVVVERTPVHERKASLREMSEAKKRRTKVGERVMTRTVQGKSVRCPEDAKVPPLAIKGVREFCGATIAYSFGCTRFPNHRGKHHAHTIDGKGGDICWMSWTTEEAVVEAL